MPTLGGRLDEALDEAHKAAKLYLSRPPRGLEVVGHDDVESESAS